MKKEAYYFSHDMNSQNDEKCLYLISKFGMAGYGLFWAFIEAMHETIDGKLDCKLIEGFCIRFNTNSELLYQFYNTAIEINLFVTDGNKYWSERVIKNKLLFAEKKNKKSLAGIAGMQARWQNHNTVITKNNKAITKDNKVKENKVKENSIDSRKLKFAHTLKPFLEFYGKDLLNSFYAYWTEPNKSNTKFKQEMQTTWDLSRRLKTWSQNESNFNSKKVINTNPQVAYS
jgi:hypothetical protein